MSKILLVLCLVCATYACELPGWPLGRALISSPIAHLVAHPVGHALVKHVHPLSLGKFRPDTLDRDQSDEIPPYYESLDVVERMEQEVRSLTSFTDTPPADDPQRHLLLILGEIYHITQRVADTCNPDPIFYDQAYLRLMAEYLLTAWSDPKDPAIGINKYIDIAQDQTTNIRTLIKNVCPIGDTVDIPACNRLVNGIILWAPEEYKNEADLLLELGDVAEKYEELLPDFNDAADKQEAIKYLADDETKEQLKPLVLAAAEAIIDFGLLQQCENPHQSHGDIQIEKLWPISRGKHLIHPKGWSRFHKLPIMPVVPAVWGVKK